MNGDLKFPAHAARWLDRISRGAAYAKARWAADAMALALMPKCVVCVAAYVALATGVGVVGREFCGGDTSVGRGLGGLMVIGTWPWMAGVVAVVGLAVILIWARIRTSAQARIGNAGNKRDARGGWAPRPIYLRPPWS